MFYSHEILTRREYGVATIWLVATLGAKSGLKKLNRKAILDVDVQKACETIVSPTAPLALRLQGNLLFGVSKVYSQQCAYVLQDAQAARTSIKTMMKVVRTSFLDPNAGKAKPEQLVLQYDPSFFPNIGAIDHDLLKFDDDADLLPNSNHTSSLLDPISQALSARSASDGDDNQPLPDLIIPTSETGDSDRHVLPREPHQEESPLRDLGFNLDVDDTTGFAQDVDFEFDQDGNIRDLTREESLAPLVSATPVLQTSRLESVEHNEDLAPLDQLKAQTQVEQEHPSIDHEQLLEPAGHHIQENQTELSQNILDVPALPQEEENNVERESSPDLVVAPVRSRGRGVKIFEMDQATEIASSALSRWNRDYIEIMDKHSKLKQSQKAARQAKKNAHHWVFGIGLGTMFPVKNDIALPNPLDLFSGDQLMLALAPEVLIQSSPKRSRAQQEEDDDDETGSEGKRRRLDKEGSRTPMDEMKEDGQRLGANNNIFPGDDNADDPFYFSGEISTEIGRAAETALEDRSSTMPWNIFASTRGSRQGSRQGSRSRQGSVSARSHRSIGVGGLASSTSLGGSGFQLAGRSSSARRQTPSSAAAAAASHRRRAAAGSVSPSVARPQGVLARLSSLEIQDDEGDRAASMPPLPPREQVDEGGDGSFIILDNAAASDEVSWNSEATLDRESTQFLDFVRHEIELQRRKEQNVTESDGPSATAVAFHEILSPDKNSRFVATQAFLHVLTLTTKGFIGVRQDEPYGAIYISDQGASSGDLIKV